ncbi:T9SS type A sorting domain-containing protein [candidate division KSB1 bacterium]|nr:T9SS type A sorting domain-containing protein [candidate division KSB1 bacterium]
MKNLVLVMTLVISLVATMAFAETTISIPITASADDAEEVMTELDPEAEWGEMDLTSSDLEIIFDHEPQYVGLLFRDLQIPPNAAVSNAYVQFTVDAIEEGITDADLTVEIYGAQQATVDSIEPDYFWISDFPPTDALVSWSPPPSVAVGDETEAERTADISVIIEEIVAIDGWAAGNNILIVIIGDSDQVDDINREFEAFDGSSHKPPVLNVTFGEATAVENDEKQTPSSYLLSQNYPNPFNPTTTINFTIPEKEFVKLSVYDQLGQKVTTLVNENMTAGSHGIVWNAADMPSGLYLYKLEMGHKTLIRKMMLLK